MTSVFPSTTASAITTFDTGLPPMQTAIVGWFTYLKELGVVATILPFNPRYGGSPFYDVGVSREDIFDTPLFSDRIKASCYYVIPKEIVDGHPKKWGKKAFSFTTLNKFFVGIKKAVNTHNRRKFIYAYWPKYDGLSHEFGHQSQNALAHFKEIDFGIKSFVEKIKDTNTTLIITSDHGFIDTTPSKTINLANHPKFLDTLVMPLSGDARVKYCYVRLSKEKEFKNYVNKYFKNYCYLFKSEELVKKNFFGLFEPHKRLHERIGDYTLIMKENYILKDPILGRKSKQLIGNHSGVSSKEIFVPLVVMKL